MTLQGIKKIPLAFAQATTVERTKRMNNTMNQECGGAPFEPLRVYDLQTKARGLLSLNAPSKGENDQVCSRGQVVR